MFDYRALEKWAYLDHALERLYNHVRRDRSKPMTKAADLARAYLEESKAESQVVRSRKRRWYEKVLVKLGYDDVDPIVGQWEHHKIVERVGKAKHRLVLSNGETLLVNRWRNYDGRLLLWAEAWKEAKHDPALREQLRRESRVWRRQQWSRVANDINSLLLDSALDDGLDSGAFEIEGLDGESDSLSAPSGTVQLPDPKSAEEIARSQGQSLPDVDDDDVDDEDDDEDDKDDDDDN